MSTKYRFIPNGTITSSLGFLAGASSAGGKSSGTLDLGILYSEQPCSSAGVFTTNKIKAAPVLLCQSHLQNRRAQAIVANSGCANACTGSQGSTDATEMAALTAKKLGLSTEYVLVASTGMIGIPLPMKLIRAAIDKAELSKAGGQDFTKAIMTTDTFPKQIAVAANIGAHEITVGGCAKGAGMIHPNMATLLCFLTTDAAVEVGLLESALQEAVNISFNMITVDGDTSTNDTVLLLANGASGNNPIKQGTPEAYEFQQALESVCVHLAKCIARDGEGATKLIEVCVEGALTSADARMAARTIASSPLVKTAVHGCDPNWGRIVAALGRSGAEIKESRIDLAIGDTRILESGRSVLFDEEKARATLAKAELPINVNLNLGKESATAWGCDLSKEYVTINSEYTT